MKFSIQNFFSKILSLLRIWSHSPKKFLMENIIFVQCYYIAYFAKLIIRLFSIMPPYLVNWYYYSQLVTRSLYQFVITGNDCILELLIINSISEKLSVAIAVAGCSSIFPNVVFS